MAKYSDEYRATAIAMLEAEGYPDNKYAVQRVADYLARQKPSPHVRTLRLWFNRKNNPAPEKLIQEKKGELNARIQSAMDLYIEHIGMRDIVDETSAGEAAKVFGILFDKSRLLEDKSTENIEVMDKTAARERLTHLINSRASTAGTDSDTEYTH